MDSGFASFGRAPERQSRWWKRAPASRIEPSAGREHLDFGPAFYLMALAAISLGTVLTIPDRTGQPLR